MTHRNPPKPGHGNAKVEGQRQFFGIHIDLDTIGIGKYRVDVDNGEVRDRQLILVADQWCCIGVLDPDATSVVVKPHAIHQGRGGQLLVVYGQVNVSSGTRYQIELGTQGINYSNLDSSIACEQNLVAVEIPPTE